MAKKNQYDNIKKDVEVIKEKLSNKELLSENECVNLTHQIERLPDVEEKMDINEGGVLDIETFLDDFNRLAENSKSKLESMLALISEGKVPSAIERKEFDEIIDGLCKKYETVCEFAEKELDEEELPDSNSSFYDYCEAIRNSKSAVLKSQLNDVKEQLKKYISVQSLVSKLALALEPFQKDAEALLERINSGEVNSVDEISDEIAGPQLFMRALEYEDLNTDEGTDILDSLEENYSYPSRITRGLSGKSYFIPDNIDDSEEEPSHDQELIEEKQDASVVQQSPMDSKSDDSKEAVTYESPEKDEVIKELEYEKNDYDDNTEEQKVDSAFTLAAKKAEIALEEKDFGLLSCEKSDAESKKLSASVFTGDLRKGNVKVLKTIIKMIDMFPYISPELIEKRYHMPTYMSEAGLEFLLRKGYLRKYKLIPGGNFYCASLRLDKALTYKEASKFVEVRQYRADQIGESIEDRASSAAARVAILKLHIYDTDSFYENDIKSYTVSNKVFYESFAYMSYDAKLKSECSIIIGIFWTEYSECDLIMEAINEFAGKGMKISRIIFAAANVEKGRSIAKVVLDQKIGGLDDAAVYIYGAAEGVFRVFDTNEEVTAEKIWNISKAQDDENNSDDESGEVLDDEKQEEMLDDDLNNDKAVNNLAETKSVDLSAANDGNDFNNTEKIIYKFLLKRKYYCSTAYAKAIANKAPEYNYLYELLAFAFNDPMRHCVYSANSIFDMVTGVHSYFSESLMASIGMRTFFSNQVRYDYNIKGVYDAIKSYEVIGEYPALSSVLYKLVEFKDEQNRGMDYYADYHAKSIAQLDGEIKKVQQEAKLFYESTIIAKKSEKANQRRFLETKKLLLDKGSEIGQNIKIVVDNDKEMQPLVVEFLQEKFIKEGNTLSENNIDADLLWDFIMEYWEKAGDKMMYRIRADLMSHLRSNIVNVTTKALQIMIRWCNLVEMSNDQTEDSSSIAYKKIKKPLLADIEEAMNAITKDIDSKSFEEDKIAGLEAIRFSLDELLRCINGTYEEYEHRFFYAPFLSTEHILLDDNFCPDLDTRLSDIEQLQPEYRILEFAKAKPVEPVNRLKEILEDGGDDYGSARLIIQYLRETAPDLIVDGFDKNINDGEEYVKETADLRKTQFIGDLELAYVSGQIDNSNSSEDKKEKILQIVDVWYQWACVSLNYGFFAKVMNAYLEEIKIQAKSREKDLLAQLDAFKETMISGLSTEDKEKKITKIQIAINNQNYTVAEDLLARASQMEDDYENIIEEHFLKDFLEDYSDYYKPVTGNSSFATLVSYRTRNKGERGGRRLADNWLPGGSNLGKERLLGLLLGFGFKVDDSSIQQMSPIGRFENYNVKTIAAKGGKRENYTHPIAAFGSAASRDGFRVVCLNGKYEAQGLIDVMKQIGNAKHTMILLDFALDKPERRILARKSKSELGDKLFVVIDRTVMMYMVKNYDETKATRMLMSLIVPFGYYQPYVWESSNVMPPEIFMGRKHELESIESPTGANIVYGGRQLGKSALLKKAKSDIDQDENGNRSVLIDVKYLDYKDVAKKIGHALYDEGVLEQDIETTDWDELSRAIRKRLQSEENRIPYLLLLLDEADAFIESCEAISYRPFDALKEIQSIGEGRFKFVIAGLRNIVRFKRDAALGNNSVLTHLEAMTVKPFQTNEARELMEVPLHYLGLEFPKDNESLITLILASTNYFPGLIQMYCAKLLSSMRSKDYAGYTEADTPIYEISEEHIKKVLADPEFMEQIKEKFVITLKLDEDNYYYLIALLMAYMYHNRECVDGYSAEDIKSVGEELEIAKIANLDNNKLTAFMEELKELNVLRGTDSEHYLFTRYSFFQMMGTSSEVDDKLVEYMEG